MDDITETELRAAFKRSRLWCFGWTYERAINTENVRRSIINQAIALRRRIEAQTGKTAPIQRALI